MSLPKLTNNSKRKRQGQNALLTSSITKTLPQSDPPSYFYHVPFSVKIFGADNTTYVYLIINYMYILFSDYNL